MFVKIINDTEETMHECTKTSQTTSDTNEDILILKIFKKDGTTETLNIDKRNSDVYFMNDDGKTVDRVACR